MNTRIIQQLMQMHGLAELTARLMVQRGITAETAEDFLRPTLRGLLPDPFHLRDMDVAVAVVIDAIMQQKPITVFGDYDVDGATSSALLIRYFRALGLEMDHYIPNRITEGYGPSIAAFDHIYKRGTQMVITVDCGAVAYEAIAHATKIGLEVLVVDHHLGGETLPDAVATINPNRLDESSPCTHLAAVGVVFLLLVGVNKRLREQGFFADKTEPDLRQWLDLVALGTVCDVMALTGLNRAYVTQGLQIMKHWQNTGLAALKDTAGVQEDPTAYTLGFMLGPRINAGGRVGQSNLGVRLLATDSASEAAQIAAQLQLHNQERQAIEQQALEEAYVAAEAQTAQRILLVADAGWHQGVIGIMASRLKDRHKKPAIVVSLLADGTAKASARSGFGVDIGAAVKQAVVEGLLFKGGGHRAAAGFECAADTLPALHAWLETWAIAHQDIPEETASYDLALPASALHHETAEALVPLEPFGQGNPEPRVCITGAKLVKLDVLKDKHLRLILGDDSISKRFSVHVMAFNAVGTEKGAFLHAHLHQPLDLTVRISPRVWRGKIQLNAVWQEA